jgi:hypothetical protein
MRKAQSQEKMALTLGAISNLPRATLVEQWEAAVGQPPPKGISRRLLEFAAAYELQAKGGGRLKPALRRQLLQPANPKGGQKPRRTAPSDYLPKGTRLVREWHGRTYTVDVLDVGFLWEGGQYHSLSEIARAITGTRWSGPRFFKA